VMVTQAGPDPPSPLPPLVRRGAPARRRVLRTSIAALIVAVFAFSFGMALVHAQSTGGDTFNVNPNINSGGDIYSVSPGGPPSAQVICPNLPGWIMVLLTEIPRLDYRSCAPCSDGVHAVCDPVQSAHPTAIPHPESPSTDCPGLLAQAQATAVAIEGGNTGPTPMIDLTKVLQECPPAFPRPINCFDMMVDAQSKVRTNPDYSRRRARQALQCYETNGRGTRGAGRFPSAGPAAPAQPAPTQQTAACPGIETGSLSLPANGGFEGSVVFVQYGTFNLPLDWNAWRDGGSKMTTDTPSLHDVLTKTWSDQIRKRIFAGRDSFDPSVRPLDPSLAPNWKQLWARCKVSVTFTLICYANARDLNVEPITTYCEIAQAPTFAPASWIKNTFWIMLKDHVLTSDIIGNSANLPPWPYSRAGWPIHREAGGARRYYVLVPYTFTQQIK
jgi:hypothetical protein